MGWRGGVGLPGLTGDISSEPDPGSRKRGRSRSGTPHGLLSFPSPHVAPPPTLGEEALLGTGAGTRQPSGGVFAPGRGRCVRVQCSLGRPGESPAASPKPERRAQTGLHRRGNPGFSEGERRLRLVPHASQRRASEKRCGGCGGRSLPNPSLPALGLPFRPPEARMLTPRPHPLGAAEPTTLFSRDRSLIASGMEMRQAPPAGPSRYCLPQERPEVPLPLP